MFDSRRKRFERQAEASRSDRPKPLKVVSDSELFAAMRIQPKRMN